MKKGFIAGLLMLACFNGHAVELNTEAKAPFGLEWEQSFESVKSKYDGIMKCEKNEYGFEQCTFDKTSSPNLWIDYGSISFDKGRLSSVTIILEGYQYMELVQTLDLLNSKLNKEFAFLEKHGADKSILNGILAKCEKRATCDNINEDVITDIGQVNITIDMKSFSDIFDKQVPDALIRYIPI